MTWAPFSLCFICEFHRFGPFSLQLQGYIHITGQPGSSPLHETPDIVARATIV